MPGFAVHFEGADGPVVIDAGTPAEARTIAQSQEPGAVIRKIKIDRAAARPPRGQRRATRGDFA